MSETGKSRGDASIEPVTIADAINYWAGNAEEFLADRHPKAHSPLFKVKKLTTVFRPYPLVGMIEPWNFPLAMLALDLVPALAAGAAVLLKPSEVTPLSAVELARGWKEIGAPAGLRAGHRLRRHRRLGDRELRLRPLHRVDGHRPQGRGGLRASGSSRAAWSSAARTRPSCWPTPISTVPPTASPGAGCSTPVRCASRWSGSSSRPRSMTSSSPSSPTRSARSQQGQESGSGFSYDTGAMATAGAARHRRAPRHAKPPRPAPRCSPAASPPASARSSSPPCSPTSPRSMTCIAEETFGPTLPVIKVADEEEAIRLANDSRLRAVGHGVDRRHRPRRADRAPAGVRCGQRQRRDDQRVLLRRCRWAAGRTPASATAAAAPPG